MLTVRMQVFIAVIIIAGLFFLYHEIHARAMDWKLALVWLFTGIIILVFDMFPALLNVVAGLMGIYSPMNMLFFFGFIFSVGIIMYLTMSVSRQNNQIRNLTQEVGLLRKELGDLERILDMNRNQYMHNPDRK